MKKLLTTASLFVMTAVGIVTFITPTSGVEEKGVRLTNSSPKAPTHLLNEHSFSYNLYTKLAGNLYVFLIDYEYHKSRSFGCGDNGCGDRRTSF